MTINGAMSSTQTSASQSSSPIVGDTGDMDTFLTLLITELQTQDPTSPMDPTTMVGQIVSLNQLGELMQINQTLQSMNAATGSTPASSTPATSNS